jgi:hypothetical protein
MAKELGLGRKPMAEVAPAAVVNAPDADPNSELKACSEAEHPFNTKTNFVGETAGKPSLRNLSVAEGGTGSERPSLSQGTGNIEAGSRESLNHR